MLIPEDQVSLSLFSFALGVEGAQVVIVIGVLLLSYLVLYFLKIPKNRWEQFTGALILIQALIMISDRI
jgi:protein-S-isoprenylcysteine O-methyltransferase Ste14